MTEMITVRAYSGGGNPLHITVPFNDDDCMRHVHKALNQFFPAFIYQDSAEWYKNLWGAFSAAAEESQKFNEEVRVHIGRFDTDSSVFYVHVWQHREGM